MDIKFLLGGFLVGLPAFFGIMTIIYTMAANNIDYKDKITESLIGGFLIMYAILLLVRLVL